MAAKSVKYWSKSNISNAIPYKEGFVNFEELVEILKAISKTSDERFFRMDVKPDYQDTPENWEDRLEAAFY